MAEYKKISEIVANTPDTINRYKNLRHDLKEFKRVHIGHFVLSFKVDGLVKSLIFPFIVIPAKAGIQ